MFEAQYGREPFDLRLTVLRLIRRLHIIVMATVLGTVVFGGGYYVKNVMLVTTHYYEAASTYKVEYTDEPSKSGDYYINETSWNTYVQSGDFIGALCETLAEMGVQQCDSGELAGMLSATLASDLHVPTVTVTAQEPELCIQVERAVEVTMTEYFAGSNPQISRITVISQAREAVESEEDVRPLRAVILSAVLSCFSALVIFLIYETGNDGIWLPASIRRRYGLKCVGTAQSIELLTNVEYIFKDVRKAAVCTAEDSADCSQIADMLSRMLQNGGAQAGNPPRVQTEWIPVPAPAICPESVKCMRKMDGVLLSVNAGSHAGRKIERALEFMAEQDIDVTAVFLNSADEWLIRAYYLIPKNDMDKQAGK